MFSQPGPVNLELAREISRHLAGEPQLLNPWTTEELIELVRLAEYEISQVAPFSFPPASSVIPLGPREWGDAMVEELAEIVEPFAGQAQDRAGSPPWAMLAPLGPVLVGAQLGAWAGMSAGRVIGSCETGLPAVSSNRTLLVATVIEELVDDLEVDGRQMRMWAALLETAHRAVFSLPHVMDAYRSLNDAYAATVQLAPESLMEQLGSITDPSAVLNLDLNIDDAGLFDASASGPSREDLQSFMGLTSGMARLMVAEAGSRMLPDLQEILTERDLALGAGSERENSVFLVSAPAEAVEDGMAFLSDVEERFGPTAAQKIWRPEGVPSPQEIHDPVGWAARVLLDDPMW